MKLLMKLKNYKKCKLWINEIADNIEVQAEKIIEKNSPACNKECVDKMKIAIELALPKNHSNYAFVGFEYIPDNTLQDITIVTVCVNNKVICNPNETLAMPNDKVFLGISEEYGDSILDTAIQTISEMNSFPTGKIIFNIGAHAECGSSKAIFAKATELLLRISQLDLENMTNELIQEEIELLL